MNELVLERQWVLIREDLNVPISDGKVANNKRLRAALPTIEYALQCDARVVLLSRRFVRYKIVAGAGSG